MVAGLVVVMVARPKLRHRVTKGRRYAPGLTTSGELAGILMPTCMSVTIAHASAHSASAAVLMDILRNIVARLMTLLDSRVRGTRKKTLRAKLRCKPHLLRGSSRATRLVALASALTLKTMLAVRVTATVISTPGAKTMLVVAAGALSAAVMTMKAVLV